MITITQLSMLLLLFLAIGAATGTPTLAMFVLLILGQSQGWDFANLDDGYELSLVLVVYLTVVLARKMFGATR